MRKNLEKTIRPVKFHIFFDFLSKEKYCVNLYLNSYAQKTGIPMWNIHSRALGGLRWGERLPSLGPKNQEKHKKAYFSLKVFG